MDLGVLCLFTCFITEMQLVPGAALHANSQTPDRAPGLAAPARSDQCGWGRVLGGVHFRQATINADYLCAPIGKAAYVRAANLRDGTSADHVDITPFL